MRLTKWIIIFLMLAGAATFAAEDPPTKKYTYDNYKVVYERNMFSKDRRPPREVQPRTTTRRVRTTTVLSIYVLRGVSAEAGRAHKFAFVEEQISGESSMAWIGTKILDGRIKDIRLDYVVFEEDGETRIVRIGEEFGKASSTVTEDVAESADGNEADDDASEEEKAEESTPSDESDILKRLLERRKRELGT